MGKINRNSRQNLSVSSAIVQIGQALTDDKGDRRKQTSTSIHEVTHVDGMIWLSVKLGTPFRTFHGLSAVIFNATLNGWTDRASGAGQWHLAAILISWLVAAIKPGAATHHQQLRPGLMDFSAPLKWPTDSTQLLPLERSALSQTTRSSSGEGLVDEHWI